MTTDQETIAALATPSGESALAILRCSGPLAAEIGAALCGRPPAKRRAIRCDYHDVGGALIDETLLTFFAGPHSYSGEDLLEISCHGNPFIAQRILEDLFARGCRAAEPGEFTRRAFLNGRIDLSQAEAVIDIIRARSDRALEAANRHLRGALGRRIGMLIDRLLEVVAGIEAYIDFPEEDLPEEDRTVHLERLRAVRAELDRLLATGRYGALLRDGIRTVILGETNAGKSTLLNRLVGFERAIVSAEPGTTRDFLEERLMLGPHCIRLLDTAGLNPAPAEVERLGIGKTLEQAREADLFLFVLDASRPLPSIPDQLACNLKPDNAIAVANKIDLASPPPLSGGLAGLPLVAISAKTGAGLSVLQDGIVRFAEAFRADRSEDWIAINARHAHDLSAAKAFLADAAAKLEREEPIELTASELRSALDALGRISGKVDNEEMLDKLFASFCIGK